MKFTNFMLSYENSKSILLANTLNEAIVILDKIVFDKIARNLNSLDDSDTTVQQLVEAEFLIPNEIDERTNYISALLSEWNAEKNLCLHILPTTACNFKCVYCYQSGINRTSSLDFNKVNKIIQFLTKYIGNKKIDNAIVVLHGGEPTINWKVVPTLLQKLDDLFQKNNITWSVQIVSNAYELTPEKSALLAKYDWHRAQFTIDGPKNVHDTRRMLTNGAGSYEKIIENIKYILDNNLINRVSIRLNFDESNWKEIKNYLYELKCLFGTNKVLLSLGYISDTIYNTTAENYIHFNALRDESLFHAYSELYKEAIRVGFEMPDYFMFEGLCTAKMKNAMVISPNGDIYKCLSGVGRSEFIVSNIDKVENLPNYLYPDMYNDCFDKHCPFIPLCNSGCRFNGYLKTGNIHSNDCKMDLLQKLNKNLLSIKYRKDLEDV